MELKHKIDFAVVIVAEKCNPNGDPCDGNIPRHDFNGYGEISDVCLKRKIRNRLQQEGESILMQTSEFADDGCMSILDRVNDDPDLKRLGKGKKPNEIEFKKIACEKWIDVRSFGQVFAFKSADAVSCGIRGPVSIGFASSIDIINVRNITITKSMNLETDVKDPLKKDSATIGSKYIVDKGVYVAYGAMYPQLADLTGFTAEDADKIKMALTTLFENDASFSRPAGSISVDKVFWWEHNNRTGQYGSSKVHHSLAITPQDAYPYYSFEINALDGLSPEVIL